MIDEIREVRHRISARVDHEPARLVAYYIELQKRYRDRFVVNPRTWRFQTDAADESESGRMVVQDQLPVK